MNNYSLGLTLHDRAVSAFPLSIGTSLALESIFSPRQEPYDASRIIPNQINIEDYQSCWINIHTLFRNLSSAIEKETFLSSTPERLAATLEEEIGVINDLFLNEGNGVCKPEFYYATYDKLYKTKIQGLDFREPSTDGQKYYDNRLKETMKILERHTDTIHKFDDGLDRHQRERALVITHHPYDLVHWNRFERLDLLESNTGVLKPRSLWQSKYYPMSGQSFTHLPFLKKLLLVFGDKTMIKPMPMVLRKEVLDVSVRYHWNPTTTKEKINIDLSLGIKDPFAASILKLL